jgi:hypothetical protein
MRFSYATTSAAKSLPAFRADVNAVLARRVHYVGGRMRGSEMESPLIAIAAAAALAGCGGGTHGSPSAAHHTAWSPAAAPAAASAISTAFRKECSGFDAAYAKIQSATQGETTVGQLMATLTGGLGNTADDWASSSARRPRPPTCPESPRAQQGAHPGGEDRRGCARPEPASARSRLQQAREDQGCLVGSPQ